MTGDGDQASVPVNSAVPVVVMRKNRGETGFPVDQRSREAQRGAGISQRWAKVSAEAPLRINQTQLTSDRQHLGEASSAGTCGN